MKEKQNRRGFTLAELLIVVAIIAVLVAISIPIFRAQLRKSRLAVNQANGRAAFSAAEAAYLDYVSAYGSIPANTYSGSYNTVTYTYFVGAGKGILNFHHPNGNRWILTSSSKICTNTDVSSWTADTIVSKENDTSVHSLKAGDMVALVWTIHMDPANGQIVGYYCAYPSATDNDYKNAVNAINSGNIKGYQQSGMK